MPGRLLATDRGKLPSSAAIRNRGDDDSLLLISKRDNKTPQKTSHIPPQNTHFREQKPILLSQPNSLKKNLNFRNKFTIIFFLYLPYNKIPSEFTRPATCGNSRTRQAESQEEEARVWFLPFRLLPQLFIFTHAVLFYGETERCKETP